MKLVQQSPERRVALWLSLTIVTLQWKGSTTVLLPLQWQPEQRSGDGPATSRLHVQPKGGRRNSPARRKSKGKVDREVALNFVYSPPVGTGKFNLDSNHSKHGAIDEADATVLIQRRVSRFLRRGEPHNVEDGLPLMWGVPKIVWVILATAVALGAWLGCIGAALWFARQPLAKTPEEEQREQMQAAAAQYFSLKGEDNYNPTPTFFGGGDRFIQNDALRRSQLRV